MLNNILQFDNFLKYWGWGGKTYKMGGGGGAKHINTGVAAGKTYINPIIYHEIVARRRRKFF